MQSSDLIPEKHLIPSFILSGSILVNDRVITKPGTLIHKTDIVRIKEKIKKYVSRGAYKLIGAFDAFKDIDINEKVCLDLGASTGGFTQILLEKNAKHVYAVDVGYGQLAQKLANDKRVTVFDRTHIKDLHFSELHFPNEKYFVCMDLSFISLTAVFPYLSNLIQESNLEYWEGVSLIKPQFELPSRYLEKGIVRDRFIQLIAIRHVWREIKRQNPNFCFVALAESPIQGTDGNHEFLLRWKWKRS
ncbi:MAG: TlyA family RNA methyltransferase [Leptospira sp.]|nr:TlyA family RNA methyltransferase [Leptospira sp.]